MNDDLWKINFVDQVAKLGKDVNGRAILSNGLEFLSFLQFLAKYLNAACVPTST